MKNLATNLLLRQLRGLDAGGHLADASDAELVQSFVTQADEAAFEALLRRHGPMVLHVCRRVLHHHQDAEDAFQATFLVLARRAGALRHPEAVGNWLYGVAYRVARNARTAAGRRAAHEGRTVPERTADPVAAITLREAQHLLDAELNRLPEKYRAPVVLCCLEGMARDEAARQLGWSPSTVKSRLERGRQLLRARLTRRGLALPAALSAVLVGESVAPAGVPAVLHRSTLRAVVDGLGKAGAVAPSRAALALSEEMLRALAATRLKAAAALLLAVGLLAVGAGLVARRMTLLQQPESERAQVIQGPALPDGTADKPTRADLFGDPLPREAIARFGTVRLRHGGAVIYLRFTPDGRTLVSAGAEGVRTWDVATGRELHHFMPPNVPFIGTFDAALSPDGRQLVLSGKPGITVWDIATARLIRTIGEGAYGQAQFSPDGRVLAAVTRSPSTQIEMWEAATGRLLRRLNSGTGSITTFAFARGGKTLITAHQKRGDEDEHTLSFWDASTGAEQRRIGVGRHYVSKLAVSPDGTLLAGVRWVQNPAGPEGWSILLWDTATGQQLRPLSAGAKPMLPGFWNSFRALAFTPDGKTLYAGGVDAELIGFDPRTGKEVRRVGQGINVPYAMAFAPDSKTLAVSFGATIHLIDMESGRERFAEFGHTQGVNQGAITADGRTVVTADARLMVLWDAQTGRQRHRLPVPKDCSTTFQLMPDGHTVVTSTFSHRTETVETLRLWDTATGKELRTIRPASDSKKTIGLLAVSPNGQLFAMRTSDEGVALLDAATGRELRTLSGNKMFLTHAVFTSDGRTLLGKGYDGTIQFWNVATGRKERAFTFPKDSGMVGPVRGRPAGELAGCTAQISADGQILAATRTASSAIELYDLNTGRLLRRVEKPSGGLSPLALAISSDNKTLAWSGYPDNAIRLVEIATGRERHRLTGRKVGVRSFVFSADGKRLLSCHGDATAVLWDLTGRLEAPGAWDRPLSARELDTRWAELAGADAGRAYEAIRRLAASPAEAVPYLAARLAPVPVADDKRLTQLVRQLDDSNFEVRQRARKELEGIGEGAVAFCRKAVAGETSLEVRRQLETFLEVQEAARRAPTAERLQALRVLEVLEWAGTAEALRLLDRLTQGNAEAQLTQEAKAARQRLAKPRPVAP